MKKDKLIRSFGTHDGAFHADEVTACALLILHGLVDKDQVFRTRDAVLLSRCDFICDVGGIYDADKRLFDHHQADYKGYLSSAGMILLYIYEKDLIERKEYEFLNDSLIMGVDAHDNGREAPKRGLCSFSNVVSNFSPIDQTASDRERTEAFFEVLDFVIGHIKRLKEKYAYHKRCLKSVSECMKKYKEEECLIFDKNLAWMESFFEIGGEEHKACFVIMPSGKHWKLRGIPPTYEDRMSVRLPLPEEWAGLLDLELKEVSGINGAIFCHKGRFISVWETKEDALQALRCVLQMEKK